MSVYSAMKRTGDFVMPPTEDNEHKHKQVPIIDCDRDTAFEVDEGIHSLIQYLFNKGIRTRNSCEDNNDIFYAVRE